MTHSPASTVLILGARGRFGLAAARAFSVAGWRVLGQTRPGALVPQDAPTGMAWLGIALDDTQALAAAAKGADVVVHALNPSAYTFKAWRREVLPLAAAAIAVTRALNATLMVPGNVYNFGAGMPAQLREDTAQQAQTVKGRIRMQMEQQLAASGVPCVVIRAGDFFGSGSNSWLDMFLLKNIRKGQMTYPGQPHIATAWAYLPDLARSFVAVAERVAEQAGEGRATLPTFEVLHFGGYSLTGDQWLGALQPLAQAQGWVVPGRDLEFKRLPWPLIRLAAPFVPTCASVLEMRYLWDTPHALTNDRLTALIGPEPHTPLEIAVQQSLSDLGLLSAPQAAPALIGA